MKIKFLRKKAKKTQKEIACLVGVSTSVYQRIENEPETASPKVLMKLCRVFGIEMDILFEEEEKIHIEYGNPYENLIRKTKLLSTYLDDIPDVENKELQEQAKIAVNAISLVARKPNLGVFGRSDAGKSHLINYLIGKSKLPVQLQPTTSTVTILCHLNERPNWLSDEVIIFSDNIHISQLANEKYCLDQKRFYKQGSIDLLSSDCIHDHRFGKTTDAYTCVVYIDSNILKTCNIIDVPGFANTDTDKGQKSDAEKAQSILTSLDILIYLSPVTGCIDQTDMPLLRPIFSKLVVPEAIEHDLPIFSNLFFVASQAAKQHSDLALSKLKDDATNRIYRHYTNKDGEGLLDVRGKNIGKKITQDTLKNIWFNFWDDIPDRRDPFINALTQYLTKTLPRLIRAQTKRQIKALRIDIDAQLKKTIDNAIIEIEKYDDLLKQYKLILSKKEVQRRFKEIEQTKTNLLKLTNKTQNETLTKSKKK